MVRETRRELTPPLAVLRSLSRAQRIAISVGALLAATLVFAREYFPYWLRPEYYERVARFDDAEELKFAMQPHIRIDGKPTLVLGDSMVAHWPWEADLIALPAVSPSSLRQVAEQSVLDRRYALAVVWVGTGNLIHAERWTPEDSIAFVVAVVGLTDWVAQHADRVVVITPMEMLGVDYSSLTQLMQFRLKCEVFDPRGVRQQGGAAMFLHDGFHLSSTGFDLLRQQLLAQGIDVASSHTEATAAGPVPAAVAGPENP